MKTQLTVLFLLAVSLVAQTPAIPDTPAGHTLKAWFDAFNSGDRARIQAYITNYETSRPVDVDAQMNFRNQTGGFELLSIDKSERLYIEFLVKEKAGQTKAMGILKVKDVAKDSDPAEVATNILRAIPPGTTLADMKIDMATRGRVVEGAAASLNEFYVYPETAKKMAEAMQSRLKSGAYDAIDNGVAFAATLTDDLQGVSHDKHLNVNFSPRALPKRDPGPNSPSPEAMAQQRAQSERNNCAFEKVERLASNIGYLKFNAFVDPENCGATVASAMGFLAHVDALIIDLRENGGGDPKMVAHISTYLFAEPTHLNDLYNRKEDKTTEFWTLKDLPGPRFAGKPVFVLTAKRTFSGGEEFTYNLKNLKRATIIGETTGGGAHPVSGHRIDDHFMIGVPFARAINPISKTNWEGTGVEPDVKVPAAEALDVAKKMAVEQMKAKKTEP
ncbi:MAG TPA: S41 family peptidase [Bryobacteraceae bacterium]|nr:S41 family peptidase [Bryobacteraceae bacterium]